MRIMRRNTELGEKEAGRGQKEGLELPEEAAKEPHVRGREKRRGTEGQGQKGGCGGTPCVHACVHPGVWCVYAHGRTLFFQVL